MNEIYIDNSLKARRSRLIDDARLYGGSILGVAGIAEAILSDNPTTKIIAFAGGALASAQGMSAGLRSIIAERHWSMTEDQFIKQQNSEIQASL